MFSGTESFLWSMGSRFFGSYTTTASFEFHFFGFVRYLASRLHLALAPRTPILDRSTRTYVGLARSWKGSANNPRDPRPNRHDRAKDRPLRSMPRRRRRSY